MRWDKDGFLKPHGPPGWASRRDETLAQNCPFSPRAADETEIARSRFPTARQDDQKIGRFMAAWVGHVAQAPFREQGSSGGMVSWVAAELLRTGAVDGVAHVAAEDPTSGHFFRYCISRSPEEVGRGAK